MNYCWTQNRPCLLSRALAAFFLNFEQFALFRYELSMFFFEEVECLGIQDMVSKQRGRGSQAKWTLACRGVL